MRPFNEKTILKAIEEIEKDAQYIPEFVFIICTLTMIYFFDRDGYVGYSYNTVDNSIGYMYDYTENKWLLDRFVPSYDRELLQGRMPAG